MNELAIPTIALEVEILCADGRTFSGRIFLPSASATHTGDMRPEEWLSDVAPFFPFLEQGAARTVLLNKHEVLVLTVFGAEEFLDETLLAPATRRVVVECRDRVLTGRITVEMPTGQSRVVDFLNAAPPFLAVREGDRRHLVRKARITRVLELQEE